MSLIHPSNPFGTLFENLTEELEKEIWQFNNGIEHWYSTCYLREAFYRVDHPAHAGRIVTLGICYALV